MQKLLSLSLPTDIFVLPGPFRIFQRKLHNGGNRPYAETFEEACLTEEVGFPGTDVLLHHRRSRLQPSQIFPG